MYQPKRNNPVCNGTGPYGRMIPLRIILSLAIDSFPNKESGNSRMISQKITFAYVIN